MITKRLRKQFEIGKFAEGSTIYDCKWNPASFQDVLKVVMQSTTKRK